MSLSAIEVNNLKKAPAVEGVLPVVHSRWSPRSFADREVSSADLHRVFEAARWTASAYNEQPWRFLVGVRNSETYKKIFGTLIGFNQGWAGSAPVLILGATSTKFSHNGTDNTYALYDLGAASSYLTLQAAALGLTTHQMAGFDQAAARQAFDIPADYALGAVIALGYQGEPAALNHEQLIAMEISPRERKTLNELVLSAWGTPANLG
ncbi:MAG: nitroreductase family protein [Terracidiphilus sp.]|nr:nitroreductase family protein [Terracidiphilus sp.]MDR3776530.1 nitroreductase family protein [Terracidiphilus sp.]